MGAPFKVMDGVPRMCSAVGPTSRIVPSSDVTSVPSCVHPIHSLVSRSASLFSRILRRGLSFLSIFATRWGTVQLHCQFVDVRTDGVHSFTEPAGGAISVCHKRFGVK